MRLALHSAVRCGQIHHAQQVQFTLCGSSERRNELCCRLNGGLSLWRTIQRHEYAQGMDSIERARYDPMFIEHQYWYRAVAYRLLGNATERPPFQTRLPVAAHDDQINVFVASSGEDDR